MALHRLGSVTAYWNCSKIGCWSQLGFKSWWGKLVCTLCGEWACFFLAAFQHDKWDLNNCHVNWEQLLNLRRLKKTCFSVLLLMSIRVDRGWNLNTAELRQAFLLWNKREAGSCFAWLRRVGVGIVKRGTGSRFAMVRCWQELRAAGICVHLAKAFLRQRWVQIWMAGVMQLPPSLLFLVCELLASVSSRYWASSLLFLAPWFGKGKCIYTQAFLILFSDL